MNVEARTETAFPTPETAPAGCRLCDAVLHRTVVDLGMSPLCESFLPAGTARRDGGVLPLRVLVCDRLLPGAAAEYVRPEEIFTEYAYFSSFSTAGSSTRGAIVETIARRLGLGPDEPGGRAGEQRRLPAAAFPSLGVPVLGIEPAANVAAGGEAKGVPTRVDFFGVRLAQQLRAEGVRADLIVGNNVAGACAGRERFRRRHEAAAEAGGRRSPSSSRISSG